MDWMFSGEGLRPATILITSGKATLLLALALGLRALLRRTSAASRYYLIGATVLLVAVLPLLCLITPDWMPSLPTFIQSRVPTEIISSPTPHTPTDAAAAAIAGDGGDAGEASPVPIPKHGGSTLLYIWLLGTAVAAGRVFLGLAVCVRNRRCAQRLDSTRILDLVDRASVQIGLRRGPAVMIRHRGTMPYVHGIVQPVLFLPAYALHWTDDQLMSVLLHELAHIKRRDHVTWPLLNLGVSWQWFNPILWIALRQMKQDRESACDDCAVTHRDGFLPYARHLLEACAAMAPATRLMPTALTFARTREVEKRIRYMLNRNINRRPARRLRRLAYIALPAIMAAPLISLSGFSAPVALRDVTPDERDVVLATLDAFYSRLSNGSDYEFTRDNFLTSDYFDPPHLTFEYMDEAKRQLPFENTRSLICGAGIHVAKEVRCRVVSLDREGDEIVVTQSVDVIADRLPETFICKDSEGNTISVNSERPAQAGAGETCRLVNGLIQKVRIRLEDDVWKVSRFDDGLRIMRMDTDNPFGPLFLIWMEDVDSRTTPFGPCVCKVLPRDLIPEAHNAKFSLEE